MSSKALFGIRAGEPEYMAELITEQPDKFTEAKRWALMNGFDRFYIVEADGKVPDFAATVNTPRRKRR